MKQLLAIISLLVCGITLCHAQDDNKTVVGVAQFSCQQESPYTHLVTEKVVEMLTNAKRFKVVDRTSRDKIQEELELRKSEAFMDSKNLVEQDVAVSAEKLITGEIVKIPVYRMKNADGSVRGYKASVAFQMKVVDVATGLSTDATSFTGQASKECLSPESAVTMAMMSLQEELFDYFRVNFPVTAKISKILVEKGGAAQVVLVSAGTASGVKVGDKFTIFSIEMIDGQPYPSEIGQATVQKVAGDNFCECGITKKTGLLVSEKIKAAAKLQCKLIVKP